MGRQFRTSITTTVCAAVLGALLAQGPASAADLGSGPRDYSSPVAPRMDLERWTGFYLGAAVGGSFGDSGISGDFGSGSIGTSGWNASVLAGYNWQVGRTVLGVETDLGSGAFGGSASNGVFRQGLDVNALGSFRGRLGFLMTPSIMVYGTAGYAWANTDFGIDGGDKTREWMNGYQLGLGTELMLNPKMTMRLEYLYTDFGDRTLTQSGLTNNIGTDFHTVRAGLTFKF